MAEWQTIDSAPRDGYVLLFGKRYSGENYYEVGQWFRDRWAIEWMEEYHAPTHWMPLPPPPGS